MTIPIMSCDRSAMCRWLQDILEREKRGEADFIDLSDALLWAESISAQLEAKLNRMMEEGGDAMRCRAHR